MKKIETVISKRAFQTVRDLLTAQRHDILVSEIKTEKDGGCTLNHGGIEYHGHESRLKIETIVPDYDAMPVVHAILLAARGLDSVDNTVAASPVENVHSIGITKLPSPAAPEKTVKNARAALPEPSRYQRAV